MNKAVKTKKITPVTPHAVAPVNQPMSFCMAKAYIDDAWDKRTIARKAIKIVRECGLEGNMLNTSYFCGVCKQTIKDYKAAQKLAINAYRQYMVEIKNTRYSF
jgi:cytidine deaminase